MKGYRKFSMCLIYLVLSSIFLAKGIVDGDAWMKYTAAVLGGFMGANLFEHYRRPE